MATPKKSKAKVKKNNTTGYNGVTVLPNGKFVGQSFYAGKTHRTEQFGTAAAAAKAYDDMASAALAQGLLKRVSLNFPPKASSNGQKTSE